MKILNYLVPVLFMFTNSCVFVSLHKSRDVTVVVKDKRTSTPVNGAKVEIDYSYNWYGMGKLLRMPKADVGVTNSKGVATLLMADFCCDTNFTVNGDSYSISDRLIDEGGFASDDAVPNVAGYTVELRPTP